MIATMELQTIPKAVIQSGKVAANEVTSSSADISVPSRPCPRRTRQVTAEWTQGGEWRGEHFSGSASVEKQARPVSNPHS